MPFVSISHGFTLHIWIVSMILTSQFGAPSLPQIAMFATSASVGYSVLYVFARRRGRTSRNRRLPAAPSQLPALLTAGLLATGGVHVLGETGAWLVVPGLCTAVFITVAGFSAKESPSG